MITQGEHGVPYPFTTNNGGVLNLTGATVEVDLIKPDGTPVVKVAEILDAANGKCQFVLSSSDLSLPGTYKYQWRAYFEGGVIRSNREFDFYVYESLRATETGEISETDVIPFVRVTEFENVKADVEDLKLNGGGGGSVPSNVILFEDWTEGETVTIDTSTTPTNTAPSVSSTFNLTSANDSTSISIPYNISDAQGGNMTVTLTKDGVATTQTVQTGTNTWNVGSLAVGSHTLKISVTDSGGLVSNELTFNLTVTATETPTTNTAPSITSSYNTTSINDSTSVSIPYTVTDAEGGSFTATYTKDGVTSTATISGGANTWNVGTLALGDHVLKIKVADSGGLTSTELTFNINVTATPDTTVPVLTITPAQTFTDQMTVNISATDSGGGTPTIYYTLDDSDPKTSGTKLTYSGPIALTETDTIKAYAVDSANNASAVQTVTYTKQVAQTGVFASDTFNRANSASLGTTDSGHTWSLLTGSFEVTNNTTKATTGTSNASMEILRSDNYSVSVDVKWSAYAGIDFRTKDLTNTYFIRLGTSGLGLFRQLAGANTSLGSHSFTPLANSNHTLKVTVSGSTIKVLLNGTEVISATDTDTTLINETKVGIRTFNDTVSTFDNFKVEAI
jgi:hypothetical protein